MAQTQAERVEQAVEAALKGIAADGRDATALTAEEALDYVQGYEPSKTEMRSFRKVFNEHQQELDDSEAPDEGSEGSEGSEDVEEDGEIEVIDPFAGDDDEAPATLKMDDRRKLAVEKARELLGDDADSAAPEEAILALRHEGHEFYGVMKGSASQASKFMADFRKTQPGGAGGGRSKRPATEFKAELQKMRTLLSAVRKTTEKNEASRMLQEVKDLADRIISGIDAGENEE